VTKNASDQPFLDLGKAFTAFFEGRAHASKAKGLLKNRRLSRAFLDAALGKLLNLLDTKVEQRGGQIINVPIIILSRIETITHL
jgi:hypothetical protein